MLHILKCIRFVYLMGLMINRELGIVLRRFLPEKQKISVLSQDHGKLNIVVRSLQNCIRIWPGNLISYTVPSSQYAKSFLKHGVQKSGYSIEDSIDIVFVPEVSTGHKLSWVHQLLEVTYYFFPLEQPCREVFELLFYALRFVANRDILRYELLLRKICMVQLLSYAGTPAPEQFGELQRLFMIVCGQAVDESERAQIELTKICTSLQAHELFKSLDSWILTVLKTHPNFNYFKAIHVARL